MLDNTSYEATKTQLYEPWYQSLILRMETHLHNTVGCKYSYNFSVVVWI